MKTRTLIVLLAALSMLGALSIDAYLPALPSIGREFNISPAATQQTLTVFLFGYAFMTLFYGTLSDSFGRRPVILVTLAVYLVASVGCAAAPSFAWLMFFRLLQGLCGGAGNVVGRAMIGDLFHGAEAQRMMSFIQMVFGVAPALRADPGRLAARPRLVGGTSFTPSLSCLSVVLLVDQPAGPCRKVWRRHGVIRFTPQSHPGALLERWVPHAFHSDVPRQCADFHGNVDLHRRGPGPHLFHPAPLPAKLWLAVRSVDRRHDPRLHALGATQPSLQPKYDHPPRLCLMFVSAIANVAYNAAFAAALPWVVVAPFFYCMGMALAGPAMMMRILNMFPKTRGLASSLMSFIFMTVFAISSGVICPYIFDSALHLAESILVGFVFSAICWWLGAPRHEGDFVVEHVPTPEEIPVEL